MFQNKNWQIPFCQTNFRENKIEDEYNSFMTSFDNLCNSINIFDSFTSELKAIIDKMNEINNSCQLQDHK